MTAAKITPVWQAVDDALTNELMALWAQHEALQGDAARERAQQAVCVGRDDAGQVCAVATAHVVVLPRLRQPMYYYRQFFADAFRGQEQTVPFLRHAHRILQDHNAGRPVPEALGIVLELRNPKLAAAYTRAQYPDIGYTFIGYSPGGFKLYVSYFPDVELLSPAPLPVTGRRPATAASAARDPSA